MQIVDAYDHAAGTVIELRPVGHMSHRFVLFNFDGPVTVTDLYDQPRPATYRNRRGTIGPTDEQAQIDIGDDLNERERYDDRDIDLHGAEDDPATRRRG